MNGVLVDSDVLLDVMTEDAAWYTWSSATLARLAETQVLYVNPIIYGEVALAFSRFEDLEAALPPGAFRRQALPAAALFLASRCLASSTARHSQAAGLRPAGCHGEDAGSGCMASMLIGAHASIADLTLLTRGPERYAPFQGLRICAPQVERVDRFPVGSEPGMAPPGLETRRAPRPHQVGSLGHSPAGRGA